MQNPDELFLEDLCNQFRQMYANIQDLRNQNNKLDEDNQNLEECIQEEAQKEEDTNINLKTQITQIQLKIPINKDELLQIEQELTEKQNLFNVLLNEKTVLQQNQIEEMGIKKELNEHLNLISQEIYQMKNNCDKHNQVSIKMRHDIAEQNQKIEEYQEKLKQLENQLQINEEALNQEQDKSQIFTDNFKEVQNEQRNILKTGTQLDSIIRESEKGIAKLWEELEKKVARITTLEIKRNQLKNKINKAFELEKQFQRITNENTEFAIQNIQIRNQLQDFIKALPQELKNRIDKPRPTSARTIIQKEYIDHNRALELNDDTICQNHIKIKKLTELISQKLQIVSNTQQEVNFLEQRLDLMSGNINNLLDQYQQMYQSDNQIASNYNTFGLNKKQKIEDSLEDSQSAEYSSNYQQIDQLLNNQNSMFKMD